jgi:anti-anti-sigma regulatory factor
MRPIDVGDELTIATVAEKKSEWGGAFVGAGEVAFEISRLSRIDGAGVQLLLAAVRDTRRGGGTVTWHGMSPALADAAALLGLTEELGIS